MKKNLLSKILLIVLIISSLALFSACEDNTDGDVKISYFESIEGLHDAYAVGSEFEYNDFKVTAVMTDGTKKEFMLNDNLVVLDKLPDLSTPGDKELFININGCPGVFAFKVYEPVSLVQLSPPQDLAVTGNKLTWKAVSNASSYEIYIDGVKSGVSKTNSYMFTISDSSTMVKFKVKAIASANTVYKSSRFSDDYILEGVTKLNSPTNLTISNGKLSWNAPAIDENSNVDTSKIHYVIKLDDGIIAGNVNGNAGTDRFGILTSTSVLLNSLNISPKVSSSETPYKLSVVAYSTENKVLRSNDSSKINYLPYRLATPANVAINGSVISWNAVQGATSYAVISGYNADYTPNVVSTVSGTTYTIPEKQASEAGINKYRIIAKGNGIISFDSYASSEVSYSVVKLASPQNVTVSGKTLSWTAVTNAVNYEIYYKESNSADYIMLSQTASTNASLSGISEIGDYSIKVKAIGNGINVLSSDFSKSVEYLCRVNLVNPEISIAGSIISWNSVENADYYVLSTQKGILKTSITETSIDLNTFSLQELPYGEYTLTLKAKTNNKMMIDSGNSNSVSYVNKLELETPVAVLSDSLITWNGITYNGINATYEIMITGQKADISGDSIVVKNDVTETIQVKDTKFDITALNPGLYDISLRAISNNSTVYPYSDYVSVTVGYKNEYTLQSPANIKINMPEGDITWNNVNYAVSYEIETVDSLGNIVNLEESMPCVNVTENGYVIKDNLFEVGNYKIKIKALKDVELPEYIHDSEVAELQYNVENLTAPKVKITDIMSNGNRIISWDNVDYAIGYRVVIKNTKTDETQNIGNVSVDGIPFMLATVGTFENGNWIAPVNSYSLNFSEYEFTAQAEEYEICVTVIGNQSNRYNSTEGVATYKKAVAEGAPQNLRLEYGKLIWDTVYGAYRYKLTIKSGKSVDPETSEVIWENTSSVYTFNNYYNQFNPVTDYLVEIQFTVRNEAVGTVDQVSPDFAQIEFNFNQKPANVEYANGILSWNAEAGTEYKIVVGNYSVNITASETGVKTFNVLDFVNEYSAGRLDIGIATLDNGSGSLESEYSMVSTYLTKLENPVLNITDGLISWKEIADAQNYLLTIDGIEYELTTTSKVYNMYAGQHTISIVARSAVANYINSDTVTKDIYKLTVPEVVLGDGYLYWEVKESANYIVKNIETENNEEVIYYNENGIDYAKVIGIENSSNYAVFAVKENCYNSDTWQSLPSNVPEFEVGNGKSGSPYEIRNVQQLKSVGKYEGYYKLVSSINMNGAEWEPVVLESGRTFDGNGLAISNFMITRTNSLNAGLFSVVRGTVKNLNLNNVTISVEGAAGKTFMAGALAGTNKGVIDGVTVNGGSIRGSIRAGGLVGRNNGLIRNCETDISVFSNSSGSSIVMVGGLVGEGYNGIIENCCSFGEVYSIASSNDVIIGGLIGCLDLDDNVSQENSFVRACYSYSNIRIEGRSVSVRAGGLIGQTKIKTYVSNCLAKGNLKVNNPYVEITAGGFIGYSGGDVAYCLSYGAPIIISAKTVKEVGGFFGGKLGPNPVECFYNVETTTIPTGSNYTSKLGLTNYQFKFAKYFTELSNQYWIVGGRDINNGGLGEDGIYYPHLINEKHLAKITVDDESGIISWEYSKGADASGTVDKPILINETKKFYAVYAENIDWCFSQTKDIVFDSNEIKSVPEFTGTYFGNGYSLIDFKITANNKYVYSGLISENFGNIYNLGIKDAYINITNTNDDLYIGGLVGHNGSGILEGCFVINDSPTGIIGKSEKGTSYIGGLVGYNNMGVIKNCYARITVAGSSHTSKQGHLGGLIGYNNKGEIKNSYAAGAVNAGPNTFASGLIGTNVKPSDTENIFGCYYDCDVAQYVDDIRGTPLTTFEMQSASPFDGWVVATPESSGWVFVEGKYAEYVVR